MYLSPLLVLFLAFASASSPLPLRRQLAARPTSSTGLPLHLSLHLPLDKPLLRLRGGAGEVQAFNLRLGKQKTDEVEAKDVPTHTAPPKAGVGAVQTYAIGEA